MDYCICGHDVELHELVKLGFEDGTEPDKIRLKWRFLCKGSGLRNLSIIKCPCYNFQPKESSPKEA